MDEGRVNDLVEHAAGVLVLRVECEQGVDAKDGGVQVSAQLAGLGEVRLRGCEGRVDLERPLVPGLGAGAVGVAELDVSCDQVADRRVGFELE